MADIVGMDGKPVRVAKREHDENISKVIKNLSHLNSGGRIKAILVAALLDGGNPVYCIEFTESLDPTTLLGVVELAKNSLVESFTTMDTVYDQPPDKEPS